VAVCQDLRPRSHFLVRMVSLMILARLLDPKDFGLVGMVTAVMGIFSFFRDFGLSAAPVQRTTVTNVYRLILKAKV